MEGIQTGDSRAVLALYKQFGPLINRLVWRMLGEDQEHDDVVHQVFINVLDSIGHLKRYEKLSSWIVGVTLNTVRYEIRKRRIRRHKIQFVSEVPDGPASTNDPEGNTIVRRFFDVVTKMRPNQRIIFTLRFVESYTLEEIAEILSCSLATTKRRLSRSKEAFLKRARRDPFLSSWIGMNDR